MKKASPNPLISIVIPTRANNFQLLENILSYLEAQTFQDFEIIIVCDRAFNKKERDDFQLQFSKKNKEKKIRLISDHNSNFVPHSVWGASYVRNQGIKAAQGEFIQLFDDDNTFDPNYLERALAYHATFSKQYDKEVFITPTLMRKNTEIIQNQGFSGYNYRLARPKIHFLKDHQDYAEIKMFSGNGIFGKAEIMKKTLYDEEIARIAEDLDFVYSIWKQEVPILVFRDLKVRHQEREKTFLEQARIGNSSSAKQKIRNLFLWVKKHWNRMQTLVFFLWSSRGISVRLSIKAFLYWGDERWKIIWGVWKGYTQGWKSFFKRKSSS